MGKNAQKMRIQLRRSDKRYGHSVKCWRKLRNKNNDNIIVCTCSCSPGKTL